MDIVHMEIKLVLQQVKLKKYIILIMQLREWKLEQLLQQHQKKM